MIFFFTPILYIILIYLIAAALPAFLLMRYVDNQPNLNRQPYFLLKQLVIAGMVSAILAGVLEYIGEAALEAAHITNTAVWTYLVVGVVEEGTKFWSMKRNTWNSPYFETRFDGIVYAVYVSLGFAIFENVKYVFNYGLTVAPGRALLAIPAHTAFAVLMGYFYGRAKYRKDIGETGSATVLSLVGYIAAVILHGTYDYLAMSSGNVPQYWFLLVVVIIYVIIFWLVRREARHDTMV